MGNIQLKPVKKTSRFIQIGQTAYDSKTDKRENAIYATTEEPVTISFHEIDERILPPVTGYSNDAISGLPILEDTTDEVFLGWHNSGMIFKDGDKFPSRSVELFPIFVKKFVLSEYVKGSWSIEDLKFGGRKCVFRGQYKEDFHAGNSGSLIDPYGHDGLASNKIEIEAEYDPVTDQYHHHVPKVHELQRVGPYFIDSEDLIPPYTSILGCVGYEGTTASTTHLGNQFDALVFVLGWYPSGTELYFIEDDKYSHVKSQFGINQIGTLRRNRSKTPAHYSHQVWGEDNGVIISQSAPWVYEVEPSLSATPGSVRLYFGIGKGIVNWGDGSRTEIDAYSMRSESGSIVNRTTAAYRTHVYTDATKGKRYTISVSGSFGYVVVGKDSSVTDIGLTRIFKTYIVEGATLPNYAFANQKHLEVVYDAVELGGIAATASAYTFYRSGVKGLKILGVVSNELSDGSSTGVPGYVFAECNVKVLTVNCGVAGVTAQSATVGANAFKDCKYLEELYINGDVTTFPATALSGTNNLRILSIKEALSGITSITTFPFGAPNGCEIHGMSGYVVSPDKTVTYKRQSGLLIKGLDKQYVGPRTSDTAKVPREFLTKDANIAMKLLFMACVGYDVETGTSNGRYFNPPYGYTFEYEPEDILKAGYSDVVFDGTRTCNVSRQYGFCWDGADKVMRTVDMFRSDGRWLQDVSPLTLTKL